MWSVPRGSPTCLASLCAHQDPKARLSFLLRHSRLSAQHACQNAAEVALSWDAKETHPVTPDQVTAHSHMRAHWKCSACLHKWQAPALVKTAGKTGCPKCGKAHAGRKPDGTRQKHPTFAVAKHALLKQWDHDRNSKNDEPGAKKRSVAHRTSHTKNEIFTAARCH
ncbi:TPA: hypothetical protein ACH3X1_007096 [Trebouxia sp. C0004]